VAAGDFVVIEGSNALKTYVGSSGLHRVFCSQCGTPIISRREGVPQVRVRLGTLDTPLDCGPQAHIFADSRARWGHSGRVDPVSGRTAAGALRSGGEGSRGCSRPFPELRAVSY